jgi:hypothetical protein
VKEEQEQEKEEKGNVEEEGNVCSDSCVNGLRTE